MTTLSLFARYRCARQRRGGQWRHQHANEPSTACGAMRIAISISPAVSGTGNDRYHLIAADRNAPRREMHRQFCAGKDLAHLVKCMPSVVREGPYMGRPAALFDRVRPFLADKDMRTVNLVYRAITRAVMRYVLLGAADAHGKGLSRHPCHSAYTGYFEKIGNMLSIVDLIEERLFVGIDIHVHHKEVI
jgi:hypothetical protein